MEGVSMILQQLSKDSANAYAHKMLGFGNIRNGETVKAVARFEKSFQINPADSSLVPLLALLSRQVKDPAKAEKWYKRVQEIFRNNPGALQAFEAEYISIK